MNNIGKIAPRLIAEQLKIYKGVRPAYKSLVTKKEYIDREKR